MTFFEDGFSRLRLLIGSAAWQQLRQAQILLCGVGGVGSWAAEALIRGGIGHLTLVDYDCLKSSNLNRQLQALQSTLGQNKAEALAQRLLDICPQAEISALALRISPENCLELLHLRPWTYVIDAIDERQAKLALLEACSKESLPVISSMGAANKLLPGEIRVADISQTDGCPLARMLRKHLRRRGVERGIQVVYSAELPVLLSNGAYTADNAESEGEKRPLGSISYLPALFGLHCAATVLTQLLPMEKYPRRGRVPGKLSSSPEA